MPLNRPVSLASALCVAASLGACTTAMDPSDMKPVDAPSHLTLPAPFSYTTPMGGICTVTIRYTLAAGTYVASFRNAEGTFFASPPRALQTAMLDNSCNKVPDGLGLKIDAGIYVPNDPRQPAKVYYTQPQHGNYDFTVTKLTFGTDDHGEASGAAGVNVTTNGTSAAAGVGTGIGSGIVNGFIAGERGKVRFLSGQTSDALSKAIVRE
jgi:hypothetical protein